MSSYTGSVMAKWRTHTKKGGTVKLGDKGQFDKKEQIGVKEI